MFGWKFSDFDSSIVFGEFFALPALPCLPLTCARSICACRSPLRAANWLRCCIVRSSVVVLLLVAAELVASMLAECVAETCGETRMWLYCVLEALYVGSILRRLVADRFVLGSNPLFVTASAGAVLPRAASSLCCPLESNLVATCSSGDTGLGCRRNHDSWVV